MDLKDNNCIAEAYRKDHSLNDQSQRNDNRFARLELGFYNKRPSGVSVHEKNSRCTFLGPTST